MAEEHKFLDLDDDKPKKKSKKAKVAKTNKATHYLLILDRSGSMSSVADSTVSGFNENVETLKALKKDFPEQTYTVSLLMFNSNIEEVHWLSDVDKLEKLTVEKYNPSGSTYLFNTVGYAVNRIKKELESKMLKDKEIKIVVSIFTDGEDTCYGQGDYKAEDVGKLNEELQKTGQWTFTYAGANHDVYAVTQKMSIPMSNTMSYNSSVAGTQSAFQTQTESLTSYATSRSLNKDVSAGFYDVDPKDAVNVDPAVEYIDPDAKDTK